MSIVRVGLAETKDFSDGYDLIFGKKDAPKDEKKEEKAENQSTQQQQNQPPK